VDALMAPRRWIDLFSIDGSRPAVDSRRIDQWHRLVYRVFDDRIELVAARYDYDE